MLPLLLLFGAVGAIAYNDRDPVLIQSLESKTREDTPVFNRIRWYSEGDRDVWMMQQSHHGLGAEASGWERLAIVVDRSARTVEYRQLEPGAMKLVGGEKAVPFRVECMMCHSNGPRAVRPDLAGVGLSHWDRLRIATWNTRIKLYGPLQNVSPLAELSGKYESEKLAVRTCLGCHNDSPFGRGFLRRQNFMAIQFMVGQGFMPPPGFWLKPGEKKQLDEFVRGL